MAPEPVGDCVVAELTGGAFGVKRVVFCVGEMSGTERRLLRKRLGSELDAVRDVIRKAEAFPGADPANKAGAAGSGEDGRVSAAEPQPEAPMEVACSSEAKRRKASPLVQQTEEANRTAPEERERLARRLAALAAALPDHVVAFLQNQRSGDSEHHGNGGEAEGDMQSVNDGGLVQLKLLLDKFAPESTPEITGRAALVDASGVSSLSQQQHQEDASGNIGGPAEKEGDAGGGTSRVQLRDIAEEYGELMDAIGVMLLSPLSQKYVHLAEHDEYVDICGDASPVVFPAAEAVEICSSPSSSSSSSGSGSSSSDSDTSSSSDSDSSSESDEDVSSPSWPPGFPHKYNTSEQAVQSSEPAPAPEKVQIAEPEEIQYQCSAPTPTACPITISPSSPLVLPKENAISAPLPVSTPEAVQIAKPEELQNMCAAPTHRPIIIGTPSPALALPKENGTSAQPPESALETVHSMEPEKLQNQLAAVAPPTAHSTTNSPPAPAAALPKENGTPAQPPAPEAVHIVEPEEPQDPGAAALAPAADDAITDLIAKAQEALERRRHEERNRARQQARQELLEMERAALPDERIHPMDMEQLGIAAFEHIVSTVEEDARRPREIGGGHRVAPACPTVMQFLGLFLKADDDGREEPEQPPGVVDMDVEEGEIQ